MGLAAMSALFPCSKGRACKEIRKMCIIPLLYGEPIKITLRDSRGGNECIRRGTEYIRRNRVHQAGIERRFICKAIKA